MDGASHPHELTHFYYAQLAKARGLEQNADYSRADSFRKLIVALVTRGLAHMPTLRI